MRRLLALAPALALLAAGPSEPRWPAIAGPVALTLPADQGAHPEYRTEWWYVTGWLTTDAGEPLGFQVTFFRTRPLVGEDNPSAFAPTQILFAHAALSDPAIGELRHGERSARAGFGVAGAKVGDIDVNVADWRLVRGADGAIKARAAGEGFAMDLTLTPTQPPIRQGLEGYSRKGPRVDQASRYLSVPQLAVTGQVERDGKGAAVTGTAWMDQEWSSDLLAPDAVGWDWTGLNGDDGSALMAFRIRRADGSSLWAGGGWRDRAGRFTALGVDDVRLRPLAWWTSPRTGGRYPVKQALQVHLPTGWRELELTPLMPDQELAGRGVLPVYWEGAVRVPRGRGYLELTGYAGKLEM